MSLSNLSEGPGGDVEVLVVHYRNYPDVISTIDSIVRAGIPPERVTIVDNSEDDEITAALGSLSLRGCRILSCSNNGYAGAINFAVSTVPFSCEYLLVSTHETLVQETAIGRLARTLRADPSAAVVGPSLLNGSEEGRSIWSEGGSETKYLRLPQHLRSGEAAALDPEGSAPSSVSWLDGAFCLYRLSVLRRYPLDERYFLYFEELAYHAKLREMGWKILVDPSAQVSQKTDGTPPYYLARNSRIYFREHTNPLRALISPMALILRAAVVALLRGNSRVVWPQLAQGIRDGARRRIDSETRESAVGS